MASIAPIVIGCIDNLAYGTIFTRAMFPPKINLMFFPARKAADEHRVVVGVATMMAANDATRSCSGQ